VNVLVMHVTNGQRNSDDTLRLPRVLNVECMYILQWEMYLRTCAKITETS